MAKKLNRDIKDIVKVAVRSLLESGFYTWIQPNSSIVNYAFELRVLGHKDNIDNLLYATSIVNDMIFLTMDLDFKDFLLKHNYNVDNLIDHFTTFFQKSLCKGIY